MAGMIKHYFAGGNTSKGFFSVYDSCLKDLNKIFILKGGPGTGKSTLIKAVGDFWADNGLDIEYMHSPFDPDKLEGVKILSGLNVSVVNGLSPNNIEAKAPGAIEKYINLGEGWDTGKLILQRDKIIHYNDIIDQWMEKAYGTFSEALKIHDDWEKIYIDSMDFEKADALTQTLIKEFYGNISLNKMSAVKHRFLGAATPKGAVDFVPNLTEDIAKRYFIKGRPGSGKSTMLKKIAQAGRMRGFDVEIYHCGFDPDSIDMVIVRELSIAIFDSTAPHEYFPSREGDEILDLYGDIIEAGTDEVFADKIDEVSKLYKGCMKAATSYLAEAKTTKDELSQLYTDTMDFEVVNKIKDSIMTEIERLRD